MTSLFDSSSYFESSISGLGAKFLSSKPVKNRFFGIKVICALLLFLPFILAGKLVKTFFRLLGAVLGFSFFTLSLGLSLPMRLFFVRRIYSLGRDLTDWALFPFGLASCCARLLFSSLIGSSFLRNLG